jgi:peptidoglycan hydrolase-like protein with peptidoglycan-binding domain
MRNAFLAGASAFALVLGGCSMFQSGDSNAPQSSSQAPAYSGASQAPSQPQAQAPSQTQHDATTDEMGPTAQHHRSASRMNADEVKQAQQKLKDDGEYQGQVDGKFGSQTAQAVKQYQQKNGLKATGRLDHDTRAKLGVGATSGAGSSAAPAATPNSGTDKPAANGPNGSL